MTGAASSRTASPGSPGGGGAGECRLRLPWYGNEAQDGEWQHWQQNDNAPPFDIASDWFPTRGPYSSSNAFTVRAQMREIAAAGVQTVIVSWWGRNRPMRAAAARPPGGTRGRLRVALHVEPFAGRRRPRSRRSCARFERVCCHRHVHLRLGLEPRRRVAHPHTQLPKCGSSPTRACRARRWRAGSPASTPTTWDLRRHVVPADVRVSEDRGLVCAPSVGPGFDSFRATGDTRVKSRERTAPRTTPVARRDPRRGRRRHDHELQRMTRRHRSSPSAVGAPYDSYNCADGLTGRAAQLAYLERTAVLDEPLPRAGRALSAQ